MMFSDLVKNQFVEAADHVVDYFARQHRNLLLAASDWTQTADAPVDKAEWAAYRQALRDAPQSAQWPKTQIPNPPGYVEPEAPASDDAGAPSTDAG